MTARWQQSPMERLQATLWQAGVEVVTYAGGRLVLRSPRDPLRRVSVAEAAGSLYGAPRTGIRSPGPREINSG